MIVSDIKEKRIRKKNNYGGNIDTSFSLLVILLPFLYLFKGIGSSLSLGEVLLIPFLLVFLLQTLAREKIGRIDIYLLGLYGVSILTTLFNIGSEYFDLGDAGNVLLRLFFYMIVIMLAREHFNLSAVIQIYITLVAIFSVYLLFQQFWYLFKGAYLPIYLRYSWQFPPEARPLSLADYYRFTFRPASLFLEPGYFSFYALPAFCLLLFRTENNVWRMIETFLIAISIFVSTSISGIVGVVLVFIMHQVLPSRGANSYIKKGFIGLIVAFIAVLVVSILSFSTDISYQRIINGGSFGQRISRGVMVFQGFTPFHKVFGIGLNNLGAYMLKNGISTPFDEANLNYGASIVQTLVFSGILGVLSLVLYMIHITRSAVKSGALKGNVFSIGAAAYEDGLRISLPVLIIFMLCYESILFTYRFAFLVILAEALVRIKYDCSEENLK